jgi:hypothetical protein
MNKKILAIAVLISLPSLAYAGELINKRLPSYLKADVQMRYRLESKDNFDFNDRREDRDAYHLLRTRIGLSYLPVKQVEGYIQMQDARAVDMQDYAESNAVHYADLRQIYLSLKDLIEPHGIIPHTKLTFGRQSLHFGSGRLIGDPDWSNIGQTFDAGRLGLAWDEPKFKVDFFGGHFTANKSPREGNDLYDRATKDAAGGYYASWDVTKNLTVEQYLINRTTSKNISFGPSGSRELDEYTIGERIIGKELKGFDFEVELARQWGDFGSQNISSMMGAALAGYTFNVPWKPRVGFEFDYASGDTDPTDGTRHTFDNLYPANHNFYGYMDLIGLQNLNAYRYSLSVNPTAKLKLTGDYHRIYLDTPKDSLYSASKTVSRTATRAVDTHVGDELDFWSSYKVCSFSSLNVGYSHFFAGPFLAATGANDDADFFYTSFTLNF